MKTKCLLITGLFFFLCLKAEAQRSNLREKKVFIFNRPIKLDSLTIVPDSFSFKNDLKITVDYDPDKGEATFFTSETYDTISVSYIVFPYDFSFQAGNKKPDSDSLLNNNLPVEKEFIVEDKKEELFESDRVYKSGVLSRGISFGNRQDIFVNSILNLHMEGELSDNLNIRASITDQNIPYQPEGNTRLVQDFDNVYIEIYNRDFSALGGDFVLHNHTSDFLKFNRNVQGIKLGTRYQILSGSESQTKASYSISKGKFFSYNIEPIDGVMGPYRIYGPGNEQFIIIIANSERVFLDGRRLERGFDNDYVIDYNTAEITFTSNVIITKFSRIVVDFEYSNQHYSRSVLNLSHNQQINKLNVSVQYFQEKDNRNQPLLFDLDQSDKEILSSLNPEEDLYGYLPGWDSVDYTDQRVLYRKTDTSTAEGNRIFIFKYTDNKEEDLYQVFFSEMGPGQGDYLRKNGGINGHIYEWAGINEGNYDPVRIVPLPAGNRVISVRSSYQINDKNSAFTEIAFSNQNKNQFNNEIPDKQGFAMKSGWITSGNEVPFLDDYRYSGQIDFEFLNAGFEGIDRFRSVEFDRNWNYDTKNDSLSSTDRIIHYSGSIAKDNKNFIRTDISQRLRTDVINGWQGTGEAGFDFSRFNISGNLFLMKNNNAYHSADWIRYNAGIFYKSKYLFPGYQYSVDRNQVKDAGSEGISTSLMDFEEHLFYIKNNDSLKTRFTISYGHRKDRIPVNGEMVDENESRTGRVNIGTQEGVFGKADFNIVYRELDHLRDSSERNDRSLLGRVDWSINLLNRHIRSGLSYMIGNSRELKREYVFIRVPAGEGTHTWRDENQDGVQDLSEFYPAINPDERNFIKLFTPTDEYVLAYDNNLIYRISAEMPRNWKNEEGIKNFLSRFSNTLSLNLKQKVDQEYFMEHIFFTGNEGSEAELISYHNNIQNNFQFNKSDPGYGIDIIYQNLSYKQLISNGFEARKKESVKMVSRLNIRHDYNLKIIIGKKETGNSSDFMEGRNYIIDGKELKTILEWQPSNFWRLSSEYAYKINRDNSSPEISENYSNVSEGGLGFRYSKASRTGLESQFRYIYIDFAGNENTARGYELLNGLKPGSNLTWRVNWQQKLINGIQINVSYEGRKSGELSVIHTGRMQVMALF